ncbi:CYTH domain-containing protein [Mucilaginibacter sp. FT3.2]|uniref:CYTH domain-containing protein n=1 Tax=Mucilaginibacter sp. FT3.2 TaxID=2723090 RepID=UPI00160ACDB0|nr:CYTH domain-containing protein [Mucilaginibacter sp. FT3.2]MBB6234872.1 CYTH domain-containing protein [Mucilaginibacter sp. FT3.2]
MGVEIERKFLVDSEQWRQTPKPIGTYFRQGYILSDADKTIRVRVTPEEGFITIKGSTNGLSRLEYEYKIPAIEGEELLDNFAVSELVKRRYCIEIAGKVWEVDEFLGDNKGLLVAEIELDSEDEKFILPPWVTTEVTGDEKYYNSKLAATPFSKW